MKVHQKQEKIMYAHICTDWHVLCWCNTSWLWRSFGHFSNGFNTSVQKRE